MAGHVGLRGVGIPPVIAAPVVLVAVVIGAFGLAPRLPSSLDGLRRDQLPLTFAWLLVAALALIQTARLSAFMLDPSAHQHSIFPDDPWLVRHCCLTAYTEGARLAAAREPNIYTDEQYLGRDVDGFNVDLYHYPPTFLVLPMVMTALAGGKFLDVRMIWFSASALMLMLAIGLTAFRMEPGGRLRVIGMAPVLWSSLPVLIGFQMANVQILVFATSVLALVLFTFRTPAGGLALAASMVAKIFPGMLFIYLIARRRWREVVWTTAAGIVLTVIAFILVGQSSFQSFFEYQVPRLSSGEAFARPFSREFAVARNMTPFGIPLKLAALGIPGMTPGVGRAISLLFLAAIVALAVRAGRRQPRSGTEAASVWLSLVCLGTLVSPFAPGDYALVGVVWLVCMDRERVRPGLAIGAWFLISMPFLVPRTAPFALQAAAFLPAQLLALGVPAWILWKAGATLTEPAVTTESSPLVLG
jgi:hypothetical protein